MIKHILFDCDGVLIDTEIVSAEVVSRWLNTNGVRMDMEHFISNYTGKTFTDILEILKEAGLFTKSIDTPQAVVYLDAEIRQNMRPINGVHEMLKAVPITSSMVSNSAEDYVLEAIEMLEANHIFEKRVFSAEMVAKGKPNPAVYHLALERLKLTQEEVLVVEDSVAGVTASVAAGLKTVGFLGGSHIREGHGNRLKDIGASELIKDHHELTQYLSSL